jgi:hypothetical protein
MERRQAGRAGIPGSVPIFVSDGKQISKDSPYDQEFF